jgi:hypothetical protein
MIAATPNIASKLGICSGTLRSSYLLKKNEKAVVHNSSWNYSLNVKV